METIMPTVISFKGTDLPTTGTEPKNYDLELSPDSYLIVTAPLKI